VTFCACSGALLEPKFSELTFLTCFCLCFCSFLNGACGEWTGEDGLKQESFFVECLVAVVIYIVSVLTFTPFLNGDHGEYTNTDDMSDHTDYRRIWLVEPPLEKIRKRVSCEARQEKYLKYRNKRPSMLKTEFEDREIEDTYTEVKWCIFIPEMYPIQFSSLSLETLEYVKDLGEDEEEDFDLPHLGPSDKDVTCSICYNTLTIGLKRLMVTPGPCGHVMCLRCAVKLQKCPFCNRPYHNPAYLRDNLVPIPPHIEDPLDLRPYESDESDEEVGEEREVDSDLESLDAYYLRHEHFPRWEVYGNVHLLNLPAGYLSTRWFHFELRGDSGSFWEQENRIATLVNQGYVYILNDEDYYARARALGLLTDQEYLIRREVAIELSRSTPTRSLSARTRNRVRSQLNGMHGEATNTDDLLKRKRPETTRYVFTPEEESYFNEVQQHREVNKFPRFRLTDNIDKSDLVLDWNIFSSGDHNVIVQQVIDVINDPNTSTLALRFFSGDRQVYAWVPYPLHVREQLENVRTTLMHSCSVGTNERERNALAFMTRQKSQLKYKLMKIEVPNDIFTLEDIAIGSTNTWWSGVSKSLKMFFKSVVPPFIKFEEIVVNLGDVQLNLELNILIQIVSNELQKYLVDGFVHGGKVTITANDLTGCLSFKRDCVVVEKQLVVTDTGYTITQLMETETLTTNASDIKTSGETTNKGVTMKRENEDVTTTVLGTRNTGPRAQGRQGGAGAGRGQPAAVAGDTKVTISTSGTDAVVDRIDGNVVGRNEETKIKRSLQKMPITAGTLMDSKVAKTLGVDAIGEKFYCKVGDKLFEKVKVFNVHHSHVVQAWPCGTYSLWGNRLHAKVDLNTEGLRVIEVTGSEGVFSNRRDFVDFKETRKQIVDWCKGTLELLTEMVLVEPGKAEVLEFPVSLGSIFPCKITWADIMPLVKVAAKHIEPKASEVVAKALSIAESKLDESKLFDCTILAKMMIDSAYYHLNKVSLQQVLDKHVVGI
jgi:hypothetical protein